MESAINKEFNSAARSGDRKKLRALLDQGADIDFQDSHGQTALIGGCMARQSEAVKYLIDKGANLELQDQNGYSGLHYAAALDNPELSVILLEGGANVDIVNPNTDQSPLMLACIHGYVKVAKVLLDHSADVRKSCFGLSVMNSASLNGRTEILKLLVDRGCKIEPSAIADARARGHEEALQFLLKESGETSPGNPSDTFQVAPGARLQIAPTAHVAIGGSMVVGGNVIINNDNSAAKSQPPAVSPTPRESAGSGVHSKELTVPIAFKEMLSLASEWQNIGSLLRVPPGVLATIKVDNPGRAMDCLREMLIEWLKMVDPRPTWEQLAEAVAIVHERKAEDIRIKYCTHGELN